MQWKITTGSDRATANVQAYTGTEGRPVFVDVTHPGVGPDAVVEIIDVTTRRVMASVACGFSDQGPKRVEFTPVADGVRSYNLVVTPIGADFGAGITIYANDTSLSVETPYIFDASTGKTTFSRRIVSPGQLVPMAGQTVRVVIRGDSIQSNAVTGGAMQLAAILSGGEYMIAWNDAVPSTTLAQFDARYGSIPTWVQYDQDWIQGGTNSPGITIANKDAIASLAAKSLARGAEPIFFAIPPTNGVPTSAHDWNSWLWGWCIKNGFRFINPWADIIDPANGNMSAAYTIEGTHPTYTGQVLAAKRILEALRPNGSSATGFKCLPFLPNVNSPTNSGIINNALHLTDTGSDGLADGWTAGAAGGTTVTPTLVPLSLPYIGKAQRFEVTTGNTWRIQSRALTTVAGHRYRLVEYFKIGSVSSDAARNGRLEVRIYDHTGAMLVDHGQWADASVAVEGILIREFVAPGASVTVSYKLFCGTAGNAAADFSIGNQQCYDLTALGLDP